MQGLRGAARRHPVTATVVPLVGLTWIALLTFLLAGQDPTPGLLIEILLFILVPGTVSLMIGGRAALGRLFAGLLRFRFAPGLWALVLVACPLLTLLVGAVTGTLRTPPDGWLAVLSAYVVATFLVGGLIANIWEETAWSGMVQGRLLARHGLLVGSLLTAIPFGLIHLPLAFAEKGLAGTTLRDALITWAILIGLAPFFRYFLGILLIETGGSTLAAGLFHASFNASGQIAALDGTWQYIPALPILVLALAAWRAAQGRSLVSGFSPQLAAGEGSAG